MKTFCNPLSETEEKEYFEQMQQGSLEAKERLVLHNMRLVTHVIKRYGTAGEDMEDLISIGTIGLIKAVATFDSTKGNRLAAYAARCIDNAILSQMRPIKPAPRNCLHPSVHICPQRLSYANVENAFL